MSSSSNVQPQQEQHSPSLQPAQEQQQPSRPIQQQQQQYPSNAFINYYPYQNPPQMGQQSTPQRHNPTQSVQPRQQVAAEEQRQQPLQYIPLQPPPQQQIQQSQNQQQQPGSKQQTLFRVLSGQPSAQGVRPYFVRPVTSQSGFSQQPQSQLRPMQQQQQQYPSTAFINYYPYQDPQQPYHIPPQMRQQSTPQRQNTTQSVQPHQQVATEEHRQQTPQYVQPPPQQQLQQSQNQQQQLQQSQNQQQQQPLFHVVPGQANAQSVRPYFVRPVSSRPGVSQQPQPQPRPMQQPQNFAPPTSVAATSLSYHSFQSPPLQPSFPQNPQQSYLMQPQIRHQSTTPQRLPSSSSQKTASVEKQQQRPSIGEKRPLSVSSAADDEMPSSSSSMAVVEERPSSADEQSLLYLDDPSLLAAFEDFDDGPSAADSLNQPAKPLTELDKKKIRVTQIAFLEFTLEFCGKVQIGENEYTAIPPEIVEEKNNLEREIQNEAEYETFSERVKSHQNQS